MKIAVVGGGNIGTLMAGEFAARGNEVRMCASRPETWSKDIDVLGPEGDVLMTGPLALVTDDLAQAVDGAELVFVTYPTFLFADLAERLLPLIGAGQAVVVVPGADAEFSFAPCTEKGAVLLGLQRVHSVARLEKRGKSVYMLGRRGELQLASIPAEAAGGYAPIFEELFEIPIRVLPNYLVETLTPSNPILHTTRLCSMFSSWEPSVTYPGNILFYETWDNASSELLIACDAELQQVCRELESLLGIDLTEVRSLKLHYESLDAPAMTHKISHIPAFKGLTSPMKEVAPGAWEPDFTSRYFRADFSYGLKVIRDFSALVGVPTPNIDRVWNWYLDTAHPTEFLEAVPADIDQLKKLYRI